MSLFDFYGYGAGMKKNNVMRTNTKLQRGFTLIEILIVTTIIALIVAFAAGKIFGGADKAKASLTKARISGLGGTLDLYKGDIGKYPTTQEGLKALIQAPNGATRWNGPYEKNEDAIKDAWNNDLIYKSPGEQSRGFEITSLGADGVEGGDGPNKDIKSWE
jgi:general secretion pathway protein G